MTLTRAVNLTYGTRYNFEEINDALDEYRRAMVRNQISKWSKNNS